MTARRTEILAAVALVLILAADFPPETMAELACHDKIKSLSPCYDYIYGHGSSPPPQCCSRLEDVVQTKPFCLCEVLYGFGLVKTRVLDLPISCNVQTPPASLCFSSPPPTSGCSTKKLNSLLPFVLTAASCAGIFVIV